MKTTYLKPKWLLPLLGGVLVAGGFVGGTAYLKLEGQARSQEAYSAMLDRLDADHKLSRALKEIHNGEVEAAAEHLDLLLCGHILRTKAEIGSADSRQQAYVQDAFVRIGRERPRNAEVAAGTKHEPGNDQIAAERILTEASTGSTDADDGVAAAR